MKKSPPGQESRVPQQDSMADSATEANTVRELLDLLYRKAPITLFSSTGVAVLMLSALYNSQIGHEVIVSWVIILVMFNLTRLILRSIRESTLVSDRYSNIWLDLYTLTTFAAGLLWSSLLPPIGSERR
jgi:hypothetical protein